jgi:hypothetical protein
VWRNPNRGFESLSQSQIGKNDMVSDINRIQMFIHSMLSEIKSYGEADNVEDHYTMIGQKVALDEVLEFIKEVERGE